MGKLKEKKNHIFSITWKIQINVKFNLSRNQHISNSEQFWFFACKIRPFIPIFLLFSFFFILENQFDYGNFYLVLLFHSCFFFYLFYLIFFLEESISRQLFSFFLVNPFFLIGFCLGYKWDVAEKCLSRIFRYWYI